jgi:fumarate reductase flavoprotein subunit
MALWVGASMQRCVPHASMMFAVASDFDASVYKRLESNKIVLNAFEYLLANGCTIFNVNVNKYGKRYSNEHMVDAYQGMALRLQDGNVAYGIWDSKLPWQKPIASPYEGAAIPNPEEVLKGLNMLADDGILYIKSNTIEGIAQQFKIPAQNLKATVERYNTFCKNGKDEDFGKPAKFLFPLETPPYFGMKFEPKLLITVGGLLINNKMQVLDTESNVIPGLYAIGTVSGDFFANAYTHHFPGHNLGRCVTFGYLAGKSITEEV